MLATLQRPAPHLAYSCFVILTLTTCFVTDVAAQDQAVAPATHEQPMRSIGTAQTQNVVASEAPGALPLRRPGHKDAATSPALGSGGSTVKMITSLGAVLALFVVVAWFLKRGAPGGMQSLPKDAFEIYGRAALNARQNVQLVRIGDRLLLVAVSASGAHTLTEITDPLEIERLSAACRRGRTGRKVNARRETAATGYGADPGMPQHLAGTRAGAELEYAESRHA